MLIVAQRIRGGGGHHHGEWLSVCQALDVGCYCWHGRLCVEWVWLCVDTGSSVWEWLNAFGEAGDIIMVSGFLCGGGSVYKSWVCVQTVLRVVWGGWWGGGGCHHGERLVDEMPIVDYGRVLSSA
jgi:hypothetical protein